MKIEYEAKKPNKIQYGQIPTGGCFYWMDDYFIKTDWRDEDDNNNIICIRLSNGVTYSPSDDTCVELADAKVVIL